MKNRILPIPFMFLISAMAFGQSYLGMEADNFSGLHGVIFNPANITDSRLKAEFNIVSADAFMGSDYLPLSLDNITNLIEDSDDGYTTFPSDNNQFLVNADILNFSFMFNLSERHSIGLLTKTRAVNNYNNVSGRLLESFADGFPNEDFDFNMNDLDGTSHLWSEIGLAYGRTIFERDYHFVKGGIILKYLLGWIFAQGHSEALTGDYDTAQRRLNTNGAFSYLITYDTDQDFTTDELTPGFGMDLGFVYEYRPRSTNYSPGNQNERAINKYKFKVGMALLDFGSIKYKAVEQSEYDLNASVDTGGFDSGFEEKLDENYSKSTVLGDVTAVLPTSLRINIDYSFTKNIFASINYTQSLNPQNGHYNNNTLNLITVAPRFESKYISLYTPINYSNLGGITFGAGLRAGPLFVGSGTLFSTLFSKKPDLANVYLGLKIPLYQRTTIKPRRRRR